jgi:hypothetical protein
MAIVGQTAPPKTEPGSEAEFKSRVKPLLTKYCVACHAGADAPAGIDIDALQRKVEVQKDPSKWQRVGRAVFSGIMPPKGRPAPTAAERKEMADWFEAASVPDCNVKVPGRVTLRRLNRAQYVNTIRDLLGVEADAAKDFPSDDVGYGFDSIGDVLSVSPLTAEKYLAAAEGIVRRAIVVPEVEIKRYDPSPASLSPGVRIDQEGAAALSTNGTLKFPISASVAGWYRLRVSTSADLAGPDFPKMAVAVNGQQVAVFQTKVERPKRQVVEIPVQLSRGDSGVSVAFINDYYEPSNPNPKRRDRNLYVDWIEVEGPVEVTGALPESNVALIGLPPSSSMPDRAGEYLRRFMSRAYRRPVSEEESAGLLSLYKSMRKKGMGYEKAMQVAFEAVLCNPNFLFRVEQPKPDGTLSGYEIATRLSYFLWSTMPDAALVQAAETGKLSTPGGLKGQVARMLADPRADTLADEFAAQWLQLRKLEVTESDPTTYPASTKSLRSAMATEVKLLFMDVVRSDRPVTDLLTTTDTFVNGELARLYGITGVRGDVFVRAKHVDPNRGGLTGMAAFLTVTSNPNRTSPVKRGKYILEELLGTPPPPPPPNVGVLQDGSQPFSERSIKERLADHRDNPACANCHRKMDGMGFSLEGFDGIGQRRTMDGKFPVDDHGEGEDGKPIDGPAGLRALLVRRKADFARTVIEKMMTFALGRGLEASDRCHVDTALAEAKRSDYRFSAIVNAVVSSQPFTRQSPN